MCCGRTEERMRVGQGWLGLVWRSRAELDCLEAEPTGPGDWLEVKRKETNRAQASCWLGVQVSWTGQVPKCLGRWLLLTGERGTGAYFPSLSSFPHSPSFIAFPPSSFLPLPLFPSPLLPLCFSLSLHSPYPSSPFPFPSLSTCLPSPLSNMFRDLEKCWEKLKWENSFQIFHKVTLESKLQPIPQAGKSNNLHIAWGR